MKTFLTIAAVFLSFPAISQDIQYPFPVQYFNLNLEGQSVQMAYMDVKPDSPNGRNVLLFHGKNFNGFYWKDVIPFLAKAGFRVIVPDQVGWGKSSKPVVHYSFFMLADNTAKLLDTLGIDKVNVIAHSMGGMLATRFTIMFQKRVEKLIYENPIGLENYADFVPYKTINELYKGELGNTYESIKNYQQTYYPQWKEEYEPYVAAQAAQLKDPEYSRIAFVNALTYQMIYEQPVVYSFDSIHVPTLLLIGQADRTVVGKKNLTEEQKKIHGNYPALGKKTHAAIRNSKLVELPGVGHIPHIQALAEFKKNVLEFLR